MKAYKLEILIIDEDVSSCEEAYDLIDDTRYENHTIVFPVTCRAAEIGEWHDDHILNFRDTIKEGMNMYFPPEEYDGELPCPNCNGTGLAMPEGGV